MSSIISQRSISVNAAASTAKTTIAFSRWSGTMKTPPSPSPVAVTP
jgi:hypothetical protein